MAVQSSPFVNKISFVTNKDDNDIGAPFRTYFFDPFASVEEWLPICIIKENDKQIIDFFFWELVSFHYLLLFSEEANCRSKEGMHTRMYREVVEFIFMKQESHEYELAPKNLHR